jgi:cation/acetate symporter
VRADPTAIAFFLLFMALTLVITWWAARRTKTTDHFFAAGGQITAAQNGFALAGDYLSAAALLGIAGIITAHGFDGFIYSIGWLVGWPIVLFLIVEPLRSLGKFTFADVVSLRLAHRPVRITAAIGTLAVVLFYLIAQLVATGSLIKLLFGIPYSLAVTLVGAAMLVYVLFGGMFATTWVQIVKSALLLGGGIILAILVLLRFEMNPLHLFAAAAEQFGNRVLQPGNNVVTGRWDAISLGLGLMFGTAGMPHILMRVYTVRDVKQARMSIFYATCLIGLFHLVVLIIGFGAMVMVGPDLVTAAGGGGNMAAPLLARVVGGNAFFGFICAVAFATMLAVVAGLTLSGVAALSHDCWTNVVRAGSNPSEREQLAVARTATVIIAIFGIGLGIVFEGQNVAFMAGLAFAIACSANFPALLLSMTWRRLSTSGAVASIVVGTSASLVLIYLSPTVQVDVLHLKLADLHDAWWFVPLRNPAIISMPLSFAAAILVSLVTRETGQDQKFEQMRRILLSDEARVIDGERTISPVVPLATGPKRRTRVKAHQRLLST